VIAADLIVVGAGPAGSAAALAADEAGLRVVLLDEEADAGGQVYRPPARSTLGAPRTTDEKAGADLRSALQCSRVDRRFGRRVWSVVPGYRVDAIGPDGSESYVAPRVVAATGTHERVVPFPGWTKPGVIGLAAATILLKSQAMSPGRRVVVAGSGPLLWAVAAKVIGAGAEVAALVDASPFAAWLRRVPLLATRPSLLLEGAAWMGAIRRARVPVYSGWVVRSARGDPAVSEVVIGPHGGAEGSSARTARVIETDCLAIGHGLVPGAELTRLLRADHRYDRLRGGWVPDCDAFGRTSLEGLYAAGDGAGIAGAVPSGLAGRLAGLAAARDAGSLGAADFASRTSGIRREHARAMRFSNAVSELMAIRSDLVAQIEPDTVVCRCEDVTRREIDEAIADGAREVNQLKHFTRCGMGPCQGRMCGDVVAELVAGHAASRENAGVWTMRPPLRPVPLDAVLGEFTYDDIPVPAPAPL
jgi:thioredoxin reductase/bacterioferritin-associated ferredoxin